MHMLWVTGDFPVAQVADTSSPRDGWMRPRIQRRQTVSQMVRGSQVREGLCAKA